MRPSVSGILFVKQTGRPLSPYSQSEKCSHAASFCPTRYKPFKSADTSRKKSSCQRRDTGRIPFSRPRLHCPAVSSASASSTRFSRNGWPRKISAASAASGNGGCQSSQAASSSGVSQSAVPCSSKALPIRSIHQRSRFVPSRRHGNRYRLTR